RRRGARRPRRSGARGGQPGPVRRTMTATPQIAIGERRYRLVTAERDGRWTARAERDDTGDPFGIEFVAASRDEALSRLTRWLEWQAEHAPALQQPHRAQRAHHPTIARRPVPTP